MQKINVVNHAIDLEMDQVNHILHHNCLAMINEHKKHQKKISEN